MWLNLGDLDGQVMLTYKPIGNISLGRPKSRWKDNIRVDCKEIDVITGKISRPTVNLYYSFYAKKVVLVSSQRHHIHTLHHNTTFSHHTNHP